MSTRRARRAARQRLFAARLMDGSIAIPTIERAIDDLHWYAHLLCGGTPERYDVLQFRGGQETRLSDSVKVVLHELLRLQSAVGGEG